MVRNYLTIAFRNLVRHKVHSLISILGLAIGIGTCTLLLRYVQHELSYDTYHKKLDRIYRAIEVNRTETETSNTRFVPTALAPSLREEIPEIETAAHAHRTWVRMTANDKTLGGIRIAAIEPQMLDILDIEFIAGSPDAIFADPGAIAVTERTARRFFGDADPIGQTVSVVSADYGGERVIRALVKDRINSTFRFSYLQAATVRRSWTGWRGNTYILLKPDADRQIVEQKIEEILDRNLKPEVAERRHYVLYPLSRVYLHLTHDYDTGFIYEAWGDISQVRLFTGVAVLVMVIACINFTNLAIARSGKRAREVGMRKVAGASRGQLAVQFLSESIIVAFISLGLGLIALAFVLPEFNAFFRRQLDLDLLDDPALALGVTALALLVGLAAGAYPTFVTASLQPATILKGESTGAVGGHWIRKGLVVIQFATSIGLIIGSCVIYLQFDFIKNADFGYDTSDHLVHMNPYVTDKFLKTSKEIRLADRYETVKQAFLDHPDAVEATAFKQDFGLTTWGKHELIVEDHADPWRVPIIEVDDDFIDVMRIKLLVGRKFDGEAFPSDHADAHSDSAVAFIVNEKAVSHLGWDLNAAPGTADSPIGKAVRWKVQQGDITGSIVGVVNDFHYVPMTEAIGPLVLAFRTKGFFNLTVRVREGGLDGAVAHFEKTWKHFAPNSPFWHTFWDQLIDQGYRQERRTQVLAHVVACIAIFLACIGLFGLASHAAEVRQKEISVRKVLGASVPSLILLVSREFVLLVLGSAVIAVPLAYPFAREWLDGFVYRTGLGPGAFLFATALTLVISQLTVAYHAFRAARTDPAVVLRKE